MAAADFLLLLAFIIVSVILGRPLSFLNCLAIANKNSAANAQSAAAFTQALGQNLGESGARLGLGSWAGSTRVNCYETKAIWGLCIALSVLYFCSGCVLPTLWLRARRAGDGGAKSAV